jgi:4-oxalocrotonate tautomerase
VFRTRFTSRQERVRYGCDEEDAVPFVEIKVIAGTTSAEGKQALIERVTDAVASVKGEGLRPHTWVVITEVESGAWGSGGTVLTSAAVNDVAAGQQ